MLTVRPACAADAPAIRACARDAYAQYIPQIGPHIPPMDADFEGDIATKSVHVAHIDGTFAGYIIFYPQGPDMLLENVAVTTPGQGIGPRLIAVCEDAARAQDIARVILYTNIHMTGPRALYPRLGYVETDRRSENGFDRVYFAKTLADELAD